LIKGTICQEDVTIVSIYVQNVYASNFIKQTLLAQLETNKITLGEFNIPLSPIEDHPDQKKLTILF
jgi:hypothetical protein